MISFYEVFGTALQTLLHKLHRGATPKKTRVCGAPLLGAHTTPQFFLEQNAWS
jgi:hypothetical protein